MLLVPDAVVEIGVIVVSLSRRGGGGVVSSIDNGSAKRTDVF